MLFMPRDDPVIPVAKDLLKPNKTALSKESPKLLPLGIIFDIPESDELRMPLFLSIRIDLIVLGACNGFDIPALHSEKIDTLKGTAKFTTCLLASLF